MDNLFGIKDDNPLEEEEKNLITMCNRVSDAYNTILLAMRASKIVDSDTLDTLIDYLQKVRDIRANQYVKKGKIKDEDRDDICGC